MKPEQIFEAWYDKVYGFVLFRVGNTSDAQDITSDVFVRVVEKLHTYDRSKAALSTWLFAITLNEIRMFLRKPGREQTPADIEEIAGLMHVEGELLRKEEMAYLYQAIESLDERQKKIVLLKYFGELTGCQIAGITGLSEANVNVILHRSREKLKNFLENCKVYGVSAYKTVETTRGVEVRRSE